VHIYGCTTRPGRPLADTLAERHHVLADAVSGNKPPSPVSHRREMDGKRRPARLPSPR
jgi:hypothetical protein